MGCSSTNVKEEPKKIFVQKNENRENKENKEKEILIPKYPYGFIGPLNRGEGYYYPDNMINTNNKKKKNNINQINQINQSDNISHLNQSSFDKELCKSIASKLPKRTQIDFQALKNLMRTKTNNLSQKEKSFVIFLWICDNISYDAKSYFSNDDVDCTPDGVYRNGVTVCSGYSRLFKNFSDYLGLEVLCVSCYAKGVSYQQGQRPEKQTNHEYNVIKLNNRWYPIDSTWGAGHIKDKKFVKCYNEYYFLADPETLINTHFPEDEKWQLTKRRYTLEEFLSWPKVYSYFYEYKFERYFPKEGLIELNNTNQQKFIIYGKDMNNKSALCSVYLLQGNIYQTIENAHNINFYEDRFEVDCIFNKRGKYKVNIFGSNVKGNHESHKILVEYVVMVENDSIQQLSFPKFYNGKEDLNIIEPVYNNLRTGENVKFKIKTNLEEIVIKDGDEWYYLKKNEQGYFEKEIIIQSQPGQNVKIGKKNPNEDNYLFLACYNVV